jgi:hypothetical protein
MVTVALQVALLPQLSATVKITVFAPKFEQLKVALFKLRLTALQLSLLPLFTAAAFVFTVPPLLSISERFLQIAMGFMVSRIKMVLVAAAKFLPQKSVPVQVSCTWPLQFPAITTEKVEVLEVPLIAQFPL